ncbi:hypothetical protein [Rhodovulum sp. BSW8]|uniref:hypothetical protein n=1 Tax=Rhodovulum sp. BSW8 TaxID=2259645 RepID=UPI001058DF24|nr:hypothetical protein [Rhodovulum sp. BSW8]
MTARLTARFGGAATLARTTDTRTRPGETGTVTTETWAVQIIETGADVEYRTGSLIQAGDLVAAMLPHADVTPALNDKLTTNAGTFTLVNAEPVRSDPSGPVMHYRLHGRR